MGLEEQASSLKILLITTMKMMMRFQSPLIMCFLLLGVTWTDFVRGNVTLAEDFHKSVGKVCRQDQYYDEHLEICSPCKEVCPTIPCPVCPHFILNPEPVLPTKPEPGRLDDSTRAFWIVLGITIFLLVFIVGAIIIWQRHRLIKMCKKKTRPREVQAEMETQQPLQGHNSTIVV